MPNKPPEQSPLPAAAKVVGVGLSFGLGLAVQIYVLGIVVGGWLDEKLGSAPWCVLGCSLLAIFVAFRQLLAGLNLWAKRGGPNFRKEK